jgi:pyrroline-5-carboxylate reductase
MQPVRISPNHRPVLLLEVLQLSAISFSMAVMIKKRIGFIGAGQMATALASGFVRAGLVAATDLISSDPSSEACQRFVGATGSQAINDNLDVAGCADVLFLAIKPQQMVRVAAELKGKLSPDVLVISIAAGIRLSVLAQGFGEQVRLVRVMPNTPCLVGKGACGYCLGGSAQPADGQLVQQLLSAVGLAFEVDEKLLDAVTGLSGSGPAFVYVIIEALSDGGVRMGLPRAVASALAAQTVLGAAQMVLSTGDHPGVLKDRVASPGGTTIAGLQALEEAGLRGGLMAAVEAATRRSLELATG